MKRILSVVLMLMLLAGCSAPAAQPPAAEAATTPGQSQQASPVTDPSGICYESRFDHETVIALNGTGMNVTGPNSLTVFASNDIIYYEDRDTYESGNPYGEGNSADKHSAEEAAGHYVVNITRPGAYRITGTLPAGQIRIDLGSNAYEDENLSVL